MKHRHDNALPRVRAVCRRLVSVRSLAVAMVLLALTLTLSQPGASAQSAEQRGRAIAEEMNQRDAGWGDLRAEMDMQLRDRRGHESRRSLRVRSLEVQGDGDKSLTIFDHPRDVKGTAFLSFTHALEPDDQWLYLPAVKRVKRISSAHKSGPFMGSEFAYEDLTSAELEKYTYRWLRDERLDGHDTTVVERIPQYGHSGYTRQVVWVDTAVWQPRKVTYFDRKGELLKTLRIDGYAKYLDRFWRAAHMHMVNHQTGKSTTLSWSDYRFRTGLGESDFDRNALKRAR